ncbi:uncharacterized protein G2W53_004036 [Senna tora]|uniref:Uncharacterized protein n=1 Tax=Senna tora TaxID=362788 RepID=A0A834XEI8_9FABA|nr:uncharacterized protein G2W53_004036 [Senna tora]
MDKTVTHRGRAMCQMNGMDKTVTHRGSPMC